jgi:hypothetical protein
MHIVSSLQISHTALTSAFLIRYGAKLITVGVNPNDSNTPSGFRLEQNYPNPFNSTTKIVYRVILPASGPPERLGRADQAGSRESIRLGEPSARRAELKVFDVLGREAASLVNEEKHPGTYEVTFDASDLSGGVYFYRLTAVNTQGVNAETRKLLLLK